jgi:hypothetical protein
VLADYEMPTDKPCHGIKKDAVRKFMEESRAWLLEAETAWLERQRVLRDHARKEAEERDKAFMLEKEEEPETRTKKEGATQEKLKRLFGKMQKMDLYSLNRLTTLVKGVKVGEPTEDVQEQQLAQGQRLLLKRILEEFGRIKGAGDGPPGESEGLRITDAVAGVKLSIDTRQILLTDADLEQSVHEVACGLLDVLRTFKADYQQ